ERLWGFGHRLYPDGDPRAGYLLTRLRATAAGGPRPAGAGAPPPATPPPPPRPTGPGSPRMAVVDPLLDATTRRGLPQPNIDLALAALAHVTTMTRGAPQPIFPIAPTT